jgi:predicted RNase H-like nuclease
MFGEDAPIWPFLERCGGSADPLKPLSDIGVFETYPVLAIIALGWTLAGGSAGRLPKYNPTRKTFCLEDWRHLCGKVASAFRGRGLATLAAVLDEYSSRPDRPRKSDQDCVDACLCLLVALHLAERQEDCLMVGDMETGYIVVPYATGLRAEIENRCGQTWKEPARWVRTFRLAATLPVIATGGT